jgi:hypothetical protein
MKTKILIVTVFVIFFFSACGPSKEEQAAAEKEKMDSIVKVTEAAVKFKFEMRLSLLDSIKMVKSENKYLENQITEYKGNLAVAIDRMAAIKEFQFGRTPDEREQQIRNQTILIDRIQKHISNQENEILSKEERLLTFVAELKKYQ